MKSFTALVVLAGLASSALAKDFKYSNRSESLCGSALATPVCCETDALGLADLDCQSRA